MHLSCIQVYGTIFWPMKVYGSFASLDALLDMPGESLATAAALALSIMQKKNSTCTCSAYNCPLYIYFRFKEF